MPHGQPHGLLDRMLTGLTVPAGHRGLLSPQEVGAAKKRGLLNIGAHLLQAGAPGPGQQGTLGNIGGAIQAAQQGGLNSILDRQAFEDRAAALELERKRQELLQGADLGDFTGIANKLIQLGDLEGVKQLSEAVKNLRTDASRLHFETQDDGTIVALDPLTGKVVNRVGMETPDGFVKLSKEQFQVVDAVRDDLVRDTRPQLDQANSAGRILESAKELQRAIQSGDTSRGSASALGMVIAFGRLIDPESVVRSQEVTTIMTQVGSAEQKAFSLWSRFVDGTLSPAVLESIVRDAAAQATAAQNRAQRQIEQAQERLKDSGIAPEKLRAVNLFADLPEELRGLSLQSPAEDSTGVDTSRFSGVGTTRLDNVLRGR